MLETISQYWEKIQSSLFPFLREELPPFTEKQQQLIEILEVVKVERFIPSYLRIRGRPPKNRAALARAFIAKMVYNMPTTEYLIDRLKTDTSLRRICGWENRREIPSASAFSRAFAEFAKLCLPQKVHEILIKTAYRKKTVCHISRDSTAIQAREKAHKKKKVLKTKKKRGRPKKGEERPKQEKRLDKQLGMTQEERLADLPKLCDVGAKQDSKGNKSYWIGYKLHIDSAEGGIPISCKTTSASLHDSQAAIPLAAETASKVTSFYDLMDSAYDAPQIYLFSKSLNHIPIIDKNIRCKEKKESFKEETKARRCINWKFPEDVRYNERSSAERVNSRLKDEFGGRMVRVRGHAKVACHLMFGILALTADALLNLIR